MSPILIFLIGGVVGVVLTLVFMKRGKKEEKKESLIKKQAQEKEANKEAILGLIETQGGRLTNDHIQMMLGISDATTTRYLDELEKEGKVRQVGATGRGVYYELVEPTK